jgi:hypothetical protein
VLRRYERALDLGTPVGQVLGHAVEEKCGWTEQTCTVAPLHEEAAIKDERG